MKRFRNSLVMIGLCLLVAGARKSDRVERVGKWEIPAPAPISQQFETPFGAVFQLEPGRFWSFANIAVSSRQHKSNCRCATCKDRVSMVVLVSQVPENMSKRRYFAVSLQVRNFPIMQGEATANSFLLAFSTENSPGRDHAAYESAIDFWGGRPSRWEVRPVNPNDPLEDDNDNALRKVHHTYFEYLPRFEPVTVTVLFDRKNPQSCFVLSNAGQFFFKTQVKRLALHQEPLRNIGFSVQESQVMPVSRYWELSAPRFSAFDDEKTFDAIVAGHTFQPYPYNAFSIRRKDENSPPEWGRISRDKNPDLIYEFARRALDDSAGNVFFDPAAAVKLLRRASRDNHLLATGLLGECLLRGVGVKQDIPEGLKLLRQAYHNGNYMIKPPYELYHLLLYRHFPILPLSPPGREPIDEWTLEAFNRTSGTEQDNRGEQKKKPQRKESLKSKGTGGRYFHDEHALRLCYGIATKMAVEGSPRFALAAFQYTLPENQQPLKTMSPYQQKFTYGPTFSYLNMKWLRQTATRGEPLAQYGLAMMQFWRNRNDMTPAFRQELHRLLTSAIRKGMRYAELMEWQLLLQEGKNITSVFTAESDFFYAEEPLYWVLKMAAAEPEQPWARKFPVDFQLEDTLQFFASPVTPRQKFCRAMLLMAYRNNPLWRNQSLFGEDRSAGLEAARCLEAAAEAGLPEAQFWFGRWLLDLPSRAGIVMDLGFTWKQEIGRGKELLKAAIAQGHGKARYILAVHEWRSDPAGALALLEPLCREKIGKALLLKAEILLARNDRRGALEAWRLAAESGEALGYSNLALFTDSQTERLQYWRNFMTRERQQRQTALLDYYYPTHTRRLPVYRYDKDFVPEPEKADDRQSSEDPLTGRPLTRIRIEKNRSSK